MANKTIEKVVEQIKNGQAAQVARTVSEVLRQKVGKAITAKKMEISRNLFNK